ncbi:uncharacterized protein LOC108426766 isoform X2 [Pygocentrus nattereri]|uniref:Immunoglobulin domain-containing protein n=2 Tax=Pygocentrus nattereri TaxID=42514 RepID=A0A3B4DXA1_PYGNA|nr:uncharacterized protein LOC108426766 isoform X2 [Pygocentrus nattereri]
MRKHRMLRSLLLSCAAVVLVLPLTALGAVEMKPVTLGETVVLKCNISLHHEIFWLRVSMEERPRLLMVTGLKSDGKLSEVWNYNSTQFTGCLVDKSFGLKISHVLKSDLASYYCGIADGKRMDFEDGVHIFAKPTHSSREITAENISNYEKDAVLSVAEKWLIPYPIFAAVLGFGQLGLVLAVAVVHVISWKKNRLSEASKRKPF